MLANPARELLRVFESWSQSSSSSARFARPLDTEEEISQALHAALLLRDIQRLVKVVEVERPEHNLSYAPKYYARWAHAPKLLQMAGLLTKTVFLPLTQLKYWATSPVMKAAVSFL